MENDTEKSVKILCKRLKITKLENKKIIVELNSVKGVVNREKNRLLVKLLTKKYFNSEKFKPTMKKVWRSIKSLCFYEMGARLMMIEFEELNNKNHVMRDSLWNFDKCLILVKDSDGGQVKNIQLKKVAFWIKVHNLPLMARNDYVGGLVGVSLGRVEDIDIEYKEVEWREFIRIKVSLDITKPLVWQKKLNIELPKSIWLHFTYKKLPNFCFYCGVLCYTHKDWEVWALAKEKFEVEGFPYGTWLQEEPLGGVFVFT